jgi:uncharacterized membrane protein
VPKGANGGVTLIGCLASALGGFLVGLAYYATLKFCLFYQEFGSSSMEKNGFCEFLKYSLIIY